MCSEISNEDIGKFQEGGEYSTDYWTYGVPDNLSCLIFPNCDSSRQTSDVNLRKAIFYSINADTILQSVWKGNGTTVHSMCPSWGTGYVTSMDSEDNYYNYNVDTAKKYLAESSYDGSKLIILTEATGNVASAAQLVQAFLNQAGIDSEIKTVDSTILQATYTDPTQWDILLTQNACNTYAVTAFGGVFDDDRYTTGTINHIYDDKLQELIDTAYNMDTASDESLLALHDYVIDNAYGMNLVNYTTTYVVPSFMDTICLSYKKTFIPGGCVYNE
jgi:ABC-type transport system substrate-binding protein